MKDDAIDNAARALGEGPLTEAGLRTHLFPLFSRVLARNEIYLANHSLGRPLDRTADDVLEALDAWYADMDEAWGPWLNIIQRFRANVARLIGLSRADGVIPKTAAGQGLRAVLNALAPDRPRVLATRGEFDSIDFILKVYHQRRRADVSWIDPDADGLFSTDAIVRRIEQSPEPPHLVIVSHIFYATGQLLPDLDRVVHAAHRRGSLVMLDVYHSTGVVPVSLERLGADFALGGSYKYLRGGPGACWLAIHPRHLSPLPEGGAGGGLTPSPSPSVAPSVALSATPSVALFSTSSFASVPSISLAPSTPPPILHSPPPRGAGFQPASTLPSPLLTTLDTGWFAKKDTFGYQRPDPPEFNPGGDAWLESTPPVLPVCQALAGLELTLAIGVDRLRAYNLEQQRFLADELNRLNVPVRAIEPRGAFLLVPHPDAPGFSATLKANGLNTDARLGHVRLCPDILNTHDELVRAASIIRRCL